MKPIYLCIILSMVVLSFKMPNEGSVKVKFDTNPSGHEHIRVLNRAYEKELIDLINQYRHEHGLNHLKVHSDLMRASRYHAADMAYEDYHEHATFNRTPNGLKREMNTFRRISNFYKGFPNAENIAAGYGSPADVFKAWIQSPGHNRNLLNENAIRMGVGYYQNFNSKFKSYWVFETAAN